MPCSARALDNQGVAISTGYELNQTKQIRKYILMEKLFHQQGSNSHPKGCVIALGTYTSAAMDGCNNHPWQLLAAERRRDQPRPIDLACAFGYRVRQSRGSHLC